MKITTRSPASMSNYEAPSESVGQLSLGSMTASERRQALEANNPAEVVYPSSRCLHEWVEAQVKRDGSATAVVSGERQLSYAELNCWANRVAHTLRNVGVGPESRVGICMVRDLELVVAVLGVLKAGGAYVPMDPNYPRERLHYLLRDSAPTALLMNGEVPEALRGAVDDTLTLIDVRGPLSEVEDNVSAQSIGLQADHLAYLIYTSGSTGQPKGVMIEHRNAGNFVSWGQQAFPLSVCRETFFCTSLNFDLSIFELFVPLSLGGRVRVVRDALEIARYPHEGSLINTVPSAISALLDLDAIPASVKTINLAGEPLKRSLAERLFAGAQIDTLCNLYGPTETTTYSTWVRMDRHSGFVAHIGRPLQNTQVYILDSQGEPVHPGVTGEIYIGGDGVARGYLNRPELSAERFLHDQFRNGGGRLYRTGDLGRHLPDGNIEYFGRNDHQVKIRGFRIELGEIEARLLSHASLKDVVVIAREDSSGDVRLVAYLIAQTDQKSPDIDVLSRYLSEQVPDYMVPSAYVVLTALPLTPNGKLDRARLPAPTSEAYRHAAYEAPQGPLETQLAKIWCEVLKLDRVGRNDHFFQIGGHSLLAVALVERLRRAGHVLAPRVIFMAPTVAGMVAELSSALAAKPVPENLIPKDCTQLTPDLLPLVNLSQQELDAIAAQVPGGASNIQDIYPLSPMQEGLLFNRLLHSRGDIHLMQSALGFSCQADVLRYLDAVGEVIARHDVLRSAFFWDGLRGPVQVVLRQALINVETLTLASAEGDILAQLRERFDPAKYCLDLHAAPLWKIFVAQDEANDRWIVLSLLHHLLVDQVALAVIRDEIELLINERSTLQSNDDRDQTPVHEKVLPQSEIPYRNFIASLPKADEWAAQQRYFQQQLGDLTEGTAAFGLQDARIDSACIAERRFDLDSGLNQRIRSVARSIGVSPASVFHLAYALILSKVSGRDDLVFGTTLLGRMAGGEGIEHAVGLYINLLPLRITIGAESAQKALLLTHQRLLELLQHEQASLNLALQCSGVPAPQALFTAILNYRHGDPTGGRTVAGGPAVYATIDGRPITALFEKVMVNYPLAVSIDDLGDQFGLHIQAVDTLDLEQVYRLLCTALDSLVGAAECNDPLAVADLGVLPEIERTRALQCGVPPTAEYPSALSIPQVFEAQVQRAPHAIAVIEADQQISYLQLNQRANQLAYALRKQGVGPDERVLIAIERGIDLIIGILGILKAGGAYVPLDPSYPAERLQHMVNDCGARWLVVAASADEKIDALCTQHALLRVDINKLALSSGDEVDLICDRPLLGETLAYVMYTSGSTGLPKGVMITHRNVLRLVINNTFAPLGAEDCVAHCASPSFDASTWEIWAPLLNGGRILTVPQSVVLDAPRLNQCLIDANVSALWLTAGLFQEYADSLAPAFGRLKYLLAGGDALDVATVRKVLTSATPPGKLINGYGPTESTTFAATYEIVQCPIALRRIPIGRPIANTALYLLDQRQQPVPFGAIGEIYIGGDGVGCGYLNREDLTTERFLADPFAQELLGYAAMSSRPMMYRTGDLGRYLADGNLEYLGRNDQQVKIRGFRIELGEIEARLTECSSIREAVVVAVGNDLADKRLVAYVTAKKVAAEIDLETLRKELAAKLPGYMLPNAYVMLTKIPLTPNGKVDRKQLPAPSISAEASGELPQGEIETRLAAIWADLLQVPAVSRNDNFFLLGGHSLLAVRLMSRLRQQMDIDVPIRALFDAPTLCEFAQQLQAQSTHQPQQRIMPVARSEGSLLSAAQQRLWFLAQTEGGNQAYHIPLGLRLRGELHVDVLRVALDQLNVRHESLRTCVRIQQSQALQVVLPATNGFALQCCDLSDAPTRETRLQEIREAEAQAPFDLVSGPLARAQLVRMAPQDHVLLITLHHLIADGWSLDILMQDLAELYRAQLTSRPHQLPDLSIQYGDYADWQWRQLSEGRWQAQLEYWTQTLAGAPVLLNLPLDYARPAVQRYEGAVAPIALDSTLTAALTAIAQREGVTLYMLLLAAWSVVLARLSGQADVVIGSPIANRGQSELESMVGLLVNTVAVRLNVTGSLRELLQHARARAVAAQANQDLPFEQVVERLNPPRSLAHTPIFQAMFAWQNLHGTQLSLPNLSIEPAGVEYDIVKCDLELNLSEADGRIVGGLAYARSLFAPQTAERQVEYLVRVLQALTANVDVSLEQIPLLSPVQSEQLLRRFNPSPVPFDHQHCIHELFEAQVLREPQAIAVIDAERALSYERLNRWANRLAHALRGAGVKPDQRVAICLDRNVAMVAGLLGILKAGGAYVPLDPSYPAERLRQVLVDSQPVALVIFGGLPAKLSAEFADDPFPLPLLVDLQALEPSPQSDANAGEQNLPVGTLGLKPSSLAYLIYTSGSTGVPKGVMIEHRSAVNLIQAHVQTCRLRAQDCVLQFASYAFDASVEEIFPALTVGARIVLRPSELLAPDASFMQLLREQAVTIAELPTAFWHAWTQRLDDAVMQLPLDALRLVVVGGEKAERRHLRRWRASKLGRHCDWLNTYGPTEATVYATAQMITADDSAVDAEPDAAELSIGSPVMNARVYILDAHGMPQPPGVIGELYIGGVAVARGYLNRPELNQERFVADPFAHLWGDAAQESATARMYRSGDLGRYLADGTIQYCGRNDQQVKIRGFRIELGEIEAHIANYPGVREAVVAAVETQVGDPRLVAYWLERADGPAVDSSALRSDLATKLPMYMVPAAYLKLSELPLTPNGKVDRKRLPIPAEDAYVRQAYEAPQSPIELQIAQVWAEVLKIDRVGRNDNFFELGGHSLLAMSLIERLRRLDLLIDVQTLFASPTLAALAESVEEVQEILI